MDVLLMVVRACNFDKEFALSGRFGEAEHAREIKKNVKNHQFDQSEIPRAALYTPCGRAAAGRRGRFPNPSP
jgi:hypothetical protein